jgi:hypothetical protein
VSAKAERGLSPASPARGRWFFAGLALTALLPACLALAHAANVGDAAHDEAALRALGLGWTGGFRALDAAWCGLFAWLPLGTRAFRAAFASAAACGLSGALLFLIGRGVLAMSAEVASPRVSDAVAAIASLGATFSPSWQLEAAAPAGSTLGAALALLPVALLFGGGRRDGERVPPLVLLALGLAVSYEPLVGLAAIASVAASVGLEGRVAAPPRRADLVARVAAFALGLAPFVLGLARRRSPLALSAGVFAALAGERGESVAGMPIPFVREDVGVATGLLVVAGLIVGARVAKARPPVVALAAIVGSGFAAMAFGAPAGPTRYGAPVLAGVGAACALAGVAMQALVVVVADAKVPFARASAAMILVLEAVLPARAADDASARAEDRPKAAAATWDEAAWGALPAGAVILIRDPRVETRLYAARATGELRGDLALVPLFDLAGRGAMRELGRDPKLTPIWRDAALLGAEEEASLSSLAESRPVVAAYDPAWDRALARHLVPSGLFARFEPEPRGGSDRRRALDDLSPSVPTVPGGPAFPSERDRLAQAIEGDPELLGLTVRLLRARVIALAAASERDVVAHAIDDLRPFSPRDAVATELVRRMATSRGAIEVKDLAP